MTNEWGPESFLAAGRAPPSLWASLEEAGPQEGQPSDSWQRSALLFHHRSEANDLALRLARQYTGHWDVVVLEQ